jgi:hypothetical protein
MTQTESKFLKEQRAKIIDEILDLSRRIENLLHIVEVKVILSRGLTNSIVEEKILLFPFVERGKVVDVLKTAIDLRETLISSLQDLQDTEVVLNKI